MHRAPPPQGVAAGIGSGRGYIDVSTVDAATSQRIANAITYVWRMHLCVKHPPQCSGGEVSGSTGVWQ